MRYIIIGAGAIGGTLGGLLFESGQRVVLVARGNHLQALQQHGLTLRTPDRVLSLPIPAVQDPGDLELRRDDVLVLAVKTQDTAAILGRWAGSTLADGGSAGEHLPLICAQNGIENERLALRHFQHVYGACLWLPALHVQPGEVVAYGAPQAGMLHLGGYPTGADALAHGVAAQLTACRLLTHVTPDVMRWKRAKLLSNLGNAAQALCGPGAELGPLVERAVEEGKRVLAAAHLGYASEEEERTVRGDQVQTRTVEGAERGGGSSWQSLKRQSGSIESDYLNGEIVLWGRTLGVAAPVNAALQRLANQAARERREPGATAIADIWRAIGAAPESMMPRS